LVTFVVSLPVTFKLSVLDQSMARGRDQGALALQETIEMAKWCEQLGYERFWVSEHHAFPSVAGSAPEILIAALGAATDKIRLGSGGIMLPHYSPYKIAEVFSMLSNLYPNRIDLGVGRAPGADMSTARALATDGRPKFEAFPQLVSKLSEYLWDDTAQPLVSPKPNEDIPVWMLGSSPDSARLAARLGLPYNLAAFINPQAQEQFIEFYQNNFKPSALWKTPYSMLTVSVFCADTEAQAVALQLTFDINFYRFITGKTNGSFLTPQEAQLYPISAELADFMRSRSALRAVGTAEQVKTKLTAIAQRFKVDEIMMVSNMYYLEDRKRNFELIKQAFE
jgi:luciferase family oxidoreductase group 1